VGNVRSLAGDCPLLQALTVPQRGMHIDEEGGPRDLRPDEGAEGTEVGRGGDRWLAEEPLIVPEQTRLALPLHAEAGERADPGQRGAEPTDRPEPSQGAGWGEVRRLGRGEDGMAVLRRLHEEPHRDWLDQLPDEGDVDVGSLVQPLAAVEGCGFASGEDVP